MVVRILKKQTDLRADGRQIRFGYRCAEDVYGRSRPGAFRQETVQMQQQGRLARPIGTDQPHPLAGADGKTDVPQRGGAVGIPVVELADFQGIHVFHPRAHMAA